MMNRETISAIATAPGEGGIAIVRVSGIGGTRQQANAIRDLLLTKMNQLRAVADEAETVTAEKYWPFPTYGKLLFGVK